MRIISSEPTTLEEVKKALSERKKDGELDYIQEQTLEYAEKFSDDSKDKKFKNVLSKLEEMKVPSKTALKIIEIWPKKTETLKLILFRERVELSEDNLNSIVEMLSK